MQCFVNSLCIYSLRQSNYNSDLIEIREQHYKYKERIKHLHSLTTKMIKPSQLLLLLLAFQYMISDSHQTWSRYSSSLAIPRSSPGRYNWRIPKILNQPLTMSLCHNPRFSRLRSCKMAMTKRKNMRQLSDKYFCKYKDRWYRSRQNRIYRHRTKRATNQCSGTKTKQVILQANEANRPHIERELLHDPENHLYQTLFVENCQTRGPINGFYCRMHQIRFKAAVWSLDPDSNEIEVLDVVTDAYCALSQL